ncbi:TMEM86A [Branchiostoma lanceolatum]|uniref:lysoplasmalogenase n=1 Tax=Branchiostoma lanceolatum TaxID=7740 RepID=A0A8J9ZJG0_BRALA|nr:TMEM86A [Branchiostoma lanceolatum]
MNSPVAVLKSVGPKLVPFFKTTCIYYILWLDADKPTLFSALIKCLPVLSLCVFVLLHGMSLSDMHTYARRILGGLVFSALGDAFLIWQHIDGIYFIYGMMFSNDLWTWTKLCACVGALLFIISDTLLGVNKFRIPIPYNRALIMTTYYAAQLGIALSVADLKDPTSGDVTTCGAPDVTASSKEVYCSNNEDMFELKDMSAHSFSNGLCCAKKME